MQIFQKKKYIETEYEERHINNLNNAGVPFVIKERREITSYVGLAYFIYSIILDCFVLVGIAWALLNLDKLL